jgi:hypothetical protein
MTWLRQHWEGVQIVAVTMVSAEPRGYCVRLIEGSGTSRTDDDGHYSARTLAFDAADALVRHRCGGHACSSSCTAWLENSEGSLTLR